MSWIAAVCTTALGTATGIALRRRLRRRTQTLQQVCLLLQNMRAQTAYLHTPFPALASSCCETFPQLTFLSDCAARCAAGAAFPEAWRSSVRQFRRSGALDVQTQQALSRLADAVCGADAQCVDGVMALYADMMQRHLADAVERERSVGALCVRVGGAVGLLVGILIV